MFTCAQRVAPRGRCSPYILTDVAPCLVLARHVDMCRVDCSLPWWTGVAGHLCAQVGAATYSPSSVCCPTPEQGTRRDGAIS